MQALDEPNKNFCFSVHKQKEFVREDTNSPLTSNQTEILISRFNELDNLYTNIKNISESYPAFDNLDNMMIKDYNILIDALQIKENIMLSNLFNYSVLMECRNVELFDTLLRMPFLKFQSCGLNNINMHSPDYKFNLSLHDFIQKNCLKDTALNISKCKCIINLGADVNEVSVSVSSVQIRRVLKITPLQMALDRELDDSFLELFVISGGEVYEPLTIAQQNRVNSVVQAVFDKMFVVSELIQKNTLLNILPKELLSIILSTTFSNLPSKALKMLEKKKAF